MKTYSNICLIGMMGSGKTTVGKALAQKLHFTFVDSDHVIENQFGSISEIFDKIGEEGFRKIEAQIIAKLTKNKSSVISMGGGAILNPDNMQSAKINGIVVFINRPAKKILLDIDRQKRPLLRDGRFAEIYKERMPLYKKYADVEIFSSGPVTQTVQKIMEAIR